ncbi:hypothetical protein CBS101457_003795 [Exobasidium rhododendri]|nr:hypothetical protein CBS101457_003795 [Exobasidium rhododendri]
MSLPSGVDRDSIIDAFNASAAIQSRATVILQLSQVKDDVVVSLFLPKVNQLLATQTGSDPGYFAALRFLSSLFAIKPLAAHAILFDSGSIVKILARAANSPGQDYTLAFITSEMLCAAANHSECRRWILSSSIGDGEKDSKIVEIDDASGEETATMHWLLLFVEKANLENASHGSMLSKVALLSSLTLHKIRKGSKGKDRDHQVGVSATQSEDADDVERRELEKRKQEDELLYKLSVEHLLHDEGKQATFLDESSNKWSMGKSTKEELARVCRLSSVESLTYLSLETRTRDAIAANRELLTELCRLGIDSSGGSEQHARTLFPQKGGSADGDIQRTSTYDLVNAMSDLHVQSQKDNALQYGLASVLANVMAYPLLLSAEEKQMGKLKRMANAKEKVKGANGEDEVGDSRMTVEAIENRITEVIAAGGVLTLVSIALATAKESRVNASMAIRETVSKAFLSMTTRQDKLQRGKIIQSGGARAVLSLSNHWIADSLRDKEGRSRPLFAPMQALSHLLITENPTLVYKDTAECIPSLVYLYLHTASSQLQRFEAALALTNVASLSESLTSGVVSCGFPKRVIGGISASNLASDARTKQEDGESKVRIEGVLHERIFLEENEMNRRSSLELLCNLLVDHSIFRQWSGEQEDEEDEMSSKNAEVSVVSGERIAIDEQKGRVMKNLTFLVTLCSPMGFDGSSGESGLKQRLAASGAVATLASSPSTCARLLALEERKLRLISNLVGQAASESHDTQSSDEVEARLHMEDISEDPIGDRHASLQLALRGLTCLDCMIQYIGWLQGPGSRDITVYKQKLVEAECIDSIKNLALSLTKSSKGMLPHPAIQSLQEQVAQQSFNSLRACKALHLV